LASLRILIVEDDRSTASFIQDIVQAAGHHVVGTAASGDEAVLKAGELRPEMVLMDIHLPGTMDGIAAGDEIYSTLDIPVIYLTGYADENTLRRAITSRSFGFIVKPFDESQIRTTIQIGALQHKMQVQSKQQQYWLSSTFESILDGVISTDRNGTVTMMNTAAEALTGWKKQEGCGRPLTEVFNVSMNPMHGGSLTDTLVGSSIARGVREYANLTAKDGTSIPVQYSSAMVRDQLKNLEGFVLIFRNVTAQRRLEEALNASRRKYKQLVNSIDGIIWEAEPHTGRFLFVSSQAERILGYSVRHWINDPRFWAEHIHAQDRSTVLAIRANRIQAGRDYECEYRMIAADGRVVWVRDVVRMMSEDAGPPRLRGFMVNITLRKWAEDSLRESEERFRSAFDYATVGMTLLRTDGKFMRVNDSFCKILGYSVGELLATNLSAITHPEDVSMSEEYFQKMIQGELESCQFEKRYIHRSGHTIWTLLSSALIRNSEGKPLYFISQIQDITDRRQALDELRKAHDELEMRVAQRTAELIVANEASRVSEEKYRALFEESSDVVFITSQTGQLIDINAAGVELSGYSSKEELLQLNMPAHLCHDAADWFRFTRIINQKGSVKDYEVTLKRKDGEKIFTCITASAAVENGKVVCYRGIMRDVTQLKVLEDELRQAQKMEAVGLLAGGVAHDFNNMLMAITGYAEILLMKTAENDSLQSELHGIRSAAETGAALTKQLLAFSRKQVLNPELLKLSKVVEGLQNMLHRLIGGDIELVLKFDEDLGYVKADPGQIQQVILNLALNARDAMATGGKLTIHAANSEFDKPYAQLSSGSYVLLAVSDSGTGIDEQVLPRIFEPFFTTKEKGKGTGLGLSTVYGIVKQSGGNIYVHSELGKGTTFEIYLPRVETVVGARPPA
jgi:two-component system cell cycle sensor histidine kinase/response regulator CckA